MGGSPGAAGAFPPRLWPGSALGCRHGELISTTHDHDCCRGRDQRNEALPAPGGWGGQDRMFGGFPPYVATSVVTLTGLLVVLEFAGAVL